MTKFRMNFLCSLFLYLPLVGNSQEKIYTVNSGALIRTGIKYHDEEKYKDAIKQYQQIPESDTNYVLALYELGLSARLDSQYVYGKEVTRKALQLLPNPYEHDLLLLMGSLYDEEKKYDSASIYFKQAIARFPNSSGVYHSRGINFYLKKEYDSAFSYFKKTIIMNPYAANSHYFLGVMAMDMGYPVQAMLSFGMSLMISPSGSRSNQSIKYLYQLANLSDQVRENMDKRLATTIFKEDYTEIETYFKSKIALDKSYKIKTKLDEALFRQLHLICEKLPVNDDKLSFWGSYYAPIYQQIFKQDLFEASNLMMVSGLNNEAVQKMAKEKSKDIERLSTMVTIRLNEIGYYRSLDTKDYVKGAGYLFSDLRIVAKGIYLDKEKNKREGEWTYYTNTGNIDNVEFYKDGKLDGPYESFYSNGQLKDKAIFKSGNVKGEVREYYKNSMLKSKGTLSDGKREGLWEEYYLNGSQALKENYIRGEKEGLAIVYYESAAKKYEVTYKNGLLEDTVREYYENGPLFIKSFMKKGKAEGMRNEYYITGALSESGSMQDGEKEGLFTSYFRNGSLLANENYKKGKLHGHCVYYFENGKERLAIDYDNGEIEGKRIEKDDEGRTVFIEEYKKGHLKKVQFYNVLNGQMAKENLIEDKEKNHILIYNNIGNLLKDAVCDRDGTYNGEYKEFFPNGSLSVEKSYEHGELNGKWLDYFSNGKLRMEGNYKDDNLDGLFKRYYNNGVLSEEGYYDNGEQQGYWYTYNKSGLLTEKEYYLNGQRHGIHYNYYPSGKVELISIWEKGEDIKFIQYDTSGNELNAYQFKPGQANTFTQMNPIGQQSRTATVTNNYLQGMESLFYPNGKIREKNPYKNGSLDSSIQEYHSNGKLSRMGVYQNGKAEGAFQYFDREGKRTSVNYFVDGESNGIDTFYAEDKSIESIIPMKDGNRHGWLQRFTSNGDLMYKYHYIEGLIVGYTYQLPDGKLHEEIPVENSAALVSLKAYYKNGKVSCEGNYQNGDYQGERTLYYPDGKIFYKTNYKDGIIDGEEKEFHLNGQLFTKKYYILGDLDGETQKYNSSGKLIETANFKLGAQQGVCAYFDDNGKLTERITYYWDTILKVESF